MPAIQPPNAEATSVQVVIMPACSRVMSSATTIAGRANVKMKKSKELRAQPPKQAQKVRFSPGANSPYQPTGPSLLAIIGLPSARPLPFHSTISLPLCGLKLAAHFASRGANMPRRESEAGPVKRGPPGRKKSCVRLSSFSREHATLCLGQQQRRQDQEAVSDQREDADRLAE